MTIKERITYARQYLAIGNVYAYRRIMASNLRGSLSARATNAFKRAMQEDRMLWSITT